MTRQVSKVTQLTQLDRIDRVIDKIRRMAYRGYFTKKKIGPVLTELRKSIENSSLPPEAMALHRKMRRRIEMMLREAPIIIEDIKSDLLGKREYYGDVRIITPKSITEFVVVRRREILGIITEEEIPISDPNQIVMEYKE